MPAVSVARAPAMAGTIVVNTAYEATLFDNAPPVGVQRRLGLVAAADRRVVHRALLVALLGWVPLLLLVLVQSMAWGSAHATTFLWEVGVHARYLVAAPLLVLAERECVPRLNTIARHFIVDGFIPEQERKRFDAALASTRRLVEAPLAEIAVVAIAYAVALAAAASYAVQELPAWATTSGATPRLSPAGWWHTLVSLPLLLILLFGWAWRLALWARLLWLVSRLDLRLVAAHPDHAAGLGFLGQSVRAFWIVALAVATIAAGRSAHLVLAGGALPTPYFIFNVCFLLVILALFVAPLIVFSPTLMQEWRRGEMEYGALAAKVGRTFEGQWIGERNVDEKALQRPDFSATTDLYSVVANVHAMRFVPVNVKDLVVLAGAMLLPFVPVVLLAVPADVIWSNVKGLLL